MTDSIIDNHDVDAVGDARDWSWLARVNSLALRDAVELYATNGLYVFPIVPDSNVPTKGSHGHLDATTDLDVVRMLWNENPNYNIGINLERSGLYCVDVDPRNGGEPLESWPDWTYERRAPITWTETTAGGGWHYVFDAKAIDGAKLRKELVAGVDVKYDGYITVAPSWRHLRQYQVVDARPPAWSPYLDGLVVKRREREQTSGSSPDDLGDGFDWSLLRELSIEPGDQDNTLQAAAGWLREFDAPDRFALAVLGALLDRFANRPGEREWTQDDVVSKWERAKRDFEPNQRQRDKLAPWMIEFAESVKNATGDELPDVLIDAADLAQIGSDDYVVKNTLDRPSVAVIHGDGGTGKTFVVLDVAFRAWLGMEWCGRRTRKVRTLYVYAENPARAFRRRDAWLRHHGRTAEELRGGVAFYPGALSLLSTTTVDALVELVRKHGFGLVVIDTYRRAIAGGNENAPDTNQLAFAAADRIKNEGACVLIVHHDNKSGGYSGGTTINGHVESRLHLTRVQEDRDVIQLTDEKQRDHPGYERTYGRLSPYVLGVDDDGDDVSSCAFEWDSDYQPPREASETERKLASQIQRVGDNTRIVQIVEDNPGCSKNKIVVLFNDGQTKTVGKGTIYGLIDLLVEDKIIRVDKTGKNNSDAYFLT